MIKNLYWSSRKVIVILV